MNSIPEKIRSEIALLEVVSFAARAHRNQMRKDRETPYFAHPIRVALVVSRIFGITARDCLLAAVLHDTIEDTNTDADDLSERIPEEVVEWVAMLTKDKRLLDEDREAAYCKTLEEAPWQVQVCKLADIFDNLTDSKALSAQSRKRAFARSRLYLDALHCQLKPEASEAWKLVDEYLLNLQANG